MSKPSRLTRLHALAVTVLVLSLLPTPTSRASAPPPSPGRPGISLTPPLETGTAGGSVALGLVATSRAGEKSPTFVGLFSRASRRSFALLRGDCGHTAFPLTQGGGQHRSQTIHHRRARRRLLFKETLAESTCAWPANP
jgi:hypothetical protein